MPTPEVQKIDPAFGLTVWLTVDELRDVKAIADDLGCNQNEAVRHLVVTELARRAAP